MKATKVYSFTHYEIDLTVEGISMNENYYVVRNAGCAGSRNT